MRPQAHLYFPPSFLPPMYPIMRLLLNSPRRNTPIHRKRRFMRLKYALHNARFVFRVEETLDSFHAMADTWPSAADHVLAREYKREDGSTVQVTVSCWLLHETSIGAFADTTLRVLVFLHLDCPFYLASLYLYITSYRPLDNPSSSSLAHISLFFSSLALTLVGAGYINSLSLLPITTLLIHNLSPHCPPCFHFPRAHLHTHSPTTPVSRRSAFPSHSHTKSNRWPRWTTVSSESRSALSSVFRPESGV